MTSSKPQTKRANRSKPPRYIDVVSADDALHILRQMIAKDAALGRRFETTAAAYLEDIDIDAVAEDILRHLKGLAVEDLWDRSGRTRYGYVSPDEAADEMLQEALLSYIDDKDRFQQLAMHTQARAQTLAICLALYRFAAESPTEFEEWAGDLPLDMADTYFNEALALCTTDEDRNLVQEFAATRCRGLLGT